MRRLIVVLAIAGCGGDDVGIPIDFDQADLDERLQSASCTYLVRCGEFPDMATCMMANIGIRSRRPFPLLTPSVTAALRAGKMVFDETTAEQCFELIATNTCDRTDMIGRAAGLWKPYPAICYSVMRGTIRGDTACAFHEECVSEYCDVPPNCEAACCIGTCFGDTPPEPVAMAFASQGQRCADISACIYGLDCVGVQGNETCEPLPAIGEPCPDRRCRDEGVTCNSDGLCARSGLPGAPCVASSDCSRFFVCDATNQCARGPDPGESCANQPCFGVNTYCADLSTCEELKADGAPCIDGHKFTQPLSCQSNECIGTYPHFVCGTSAECL